NYTGKSSMINVLIFALYNISRHGSVKDIANKNATKYAVECVFSVLDVDYKIRRTGDRNEGNQQTVVILYKMNENGEWEDISEAKATQTNAAIVKLIGSY